MRYLFGDSTDFPLPYNFLVTLDAFVTCAGRSVALELERQSFKASTADSAAARVKSLREVEGFHRVILNAVQECKRRSSDAMATDYIRQVQEHAAQLLENTKRNHADASDREMTYAAQAGDRCRGEVRTAFESFLTVGR